MLTQVKLNKNDFGSDKSGFCDGFGGSCFMFIDVSFEHILQENRA